MRGKHGFIVRVFFHFWDHPRRCGENVADKPHGDACVGSPPQVRGKQEIEKMTNATIRITPAGAGKTGDRNSISLAVTDHPRRCGENTKKYAFIGITPGSPPQVRGKLKIKPSL